MKKHAENGRNVHEILSSSGRWNGSVGRITWNGRSRGRPLRGRGRLKRCLGEGSYVRRRASVCHRRGKR